MAGSFTRLNALVSDLDQASLERMEDARTLIAAGRSSTAIASGLYALEIRLKVSICKRLDLPKLPEAFQIHDLEALLILSGLKSRLDEPAALNVKKNWSSILTMHGQLNEFRYKPDRMWSITQATSFMGWLEDPQDGVIPWLLAQQ